MHRFLAALFLLVPAAAAAAPPRYVPAPPGKVYYMLHATGSSLSGAQTSESVEIAAHPVAGKHDVESEWTKTETEIGLSAGCGLGRFLFIPSMDVALSVPFYMRAFSLKKYLVASDPVSVQGSYTMMTLHNSVTAPESGSGIGDAMLSAMAMVYGDNASGTWIAGKVRLSLPTGASASERFVRILHGERTGPAAGDGVPRIAPVMSVFKVLGGQRTYLNVEYGIPLKPEEKFSVTTGYMVAPNSLPYEDSRRTYEESFKTSGVLLGTLGVETSLKLFGVIPGVEMNVRSWQASSWEEDGANPLDGPTTASGFPTHTPAFLSDAAWVIGGVPLKGNTEVEVSLVGTARFSGGSVLKGGLSYISSSFGNSLGFRLTFVSLFVERPGSDRAVPGKPEAREMNVAPVLDAPLAPAALIRTGVGFPMFGSGISQEEASWVAGQLRAGMGRMRTYDVMREKDMEQIAYEPCGDADCGTRYGRALKLQAYVVSRLAKVGGSFALGVQMINVADGTVAASDSVSSASLEEMRGQIPALLGRLTAPPAAPADSGTR